MKVVIDEKVLEEHDITANQYLYLMGLINPLSDKECKELVSKGIISRQYENGLPKGYFISPFGTELIDSIIINSDKETKESRDRLTDLAITLRELFPEGKKSGTRYYWRGNVHDIRNRLKIFFKNYGDYPDDIIIKATKKYVEDYSSDTTLMRLLCYFIYKTEADGKQSDLLTYIDNIDSKDGGDIKTTKLIAR